MSALPPCQETGQQVGRDERGAPALDLADVGLLVVAADSRHQGSRPMITWPRVIAEKPNLSANHREKPP